MPKWGCYSMNLLGTRAQLHRSTVHTHTHKQQQWDTHYLSALCPWLCGKNCTIIMREGEVNNAYDFWEKNPSSSVTGIPPGSLLVSMSRINHTFPYSNKRIPAHVGAMIQSLKGI